MKILSKYLLRGTPALLITLGAGFVMASSADVRAGLGMGVCVIIALLFSSIVVSSLRNIIPDRFHLPIYILIMTGFVSIIDMLMQAWFPDICNMLGVHLAALSVSAVIYRDCEEVAGVSSEQKSILTALLTGLLFLVIMVICALFREVLGNASFCGIEIAFLKDYKINALTSAFGGYLVLAICVAVLKKIGALLTKEAK